MIFYIVTSLRKRINILCTLRMATTNQKFIEKTNQTVSWVVSEMYDLYKASIVQLCWFFIVPKWK